MEDTRPYIIDDDDQWKVPDDEPRVELSTRDEDSVPFSVPRD